MATQKNFDPNLQRGRTGKDEAGGRHPPTIGRELSIVECPTSLILAFDPLLLPCV